MMTRTVSFTPTLLAIASRPLARVLTSSWMERVATANFVSLEELLATLVERYPELRCSREVCLDTGCRQPGASRWQSGRAWTRRRSMHLIWDDGSLAVI
jgi:hypothetical protein